jgi:hypothetical protein
MGSTGGAKDGSPAAESGLVAAKRQKTTRRKIPQGSLNLNGARRHANPPRLATAKAAAGAKGPEGISSDDDDELHDEASSDNDNELHDKATLTMPTKPRKGGQTTSPVVKTASTGRTAPVKVAKLRLEAASNETQVVARAGLPTATHLTMDDDDEDVDVTTTIKRGLPMATALGNNCIIGGPAPAGMISSARKIAPGRAAKLRIGAASNKTWVVARAGMPAATHLTMDNDDEDVNVATAIKPGLAMATALGNDRIIGWSQPQVMGE